MWRTHKAANRPWPVISQDPVIDYMIMEAVLMKVRKQEADQQKKVEREEWKTKRDHLKP